MDGTRKPVPDDVAGGSAAAAVRRSLAQLTPRPARIGIAVSGGIDSAMLAVAAAAVAPQLGITPHCFHIHHGLQSAADGWQAQVHALAMHLGLSCHSLRVQVGSTGRQGIEAAARQARYRGLAQLARQAGVQHILLGHHRDDQAETVLLRLLRGSGPEGLAAMAPVLQRDGLCYLRPFLSLDRQALADAALRFQNDAGWDWQPVQDPSNADDRYTRSALRERLTPELDARWPAWRATLARHAQLGAQTREVLHDVATQDLATLLPGSDGRSFALAPWRALTPARQALVLRHWLQGQGLPMPTERRLQDILRQLRGLHAMGHDRQMRVRHADAWIRCERGRVVLEPCVSGSGLDALQDVADDID